METKLQKKLNPHWENGNKATEKKFKPTLGEWKQSYRKKLNPHWENGNKATEKN